MSSHEILESLKKTITEYDSSGAASWARKAVEENLNPIEAIDALITAIRGIGDAFGKGELWLPDLMGAAEAMQSAMPIFEEEIKNKGMVRESLGTAKVPRRKPRNSTGRESPRPHSAILCVQSRDSGAIWKGDSQNLHF